MIGYKYHTCGFHKKYKILKHYIYIGLFIIFNARTPFFKTLPFQRFRTLALTEPIRVVCSFVFTSLAVYDRVDR